jgi:hypothetical protein
MADLIVVVMSGSVLVVIANHPPPHKSRKESKNPPLQGIPSVEPVEPASSKRRRRHSLDGRGRSFGHIRLFGSGEDKGVVQGARPAVNQCRQIQEGHLPTGQDKGGAWTVTGWRLPRCQSSGNGDFKGRVGRHGLSGICHESPHDSNPGSCGPHDQRRHDPVPGPTPKQTRRHQDLAGCVITTRSSDPAAGTISRKRAIWTQNCVKVSHRPGRRRTDLRRDTFVTGDVELPEPKNTKNNHDRSHDRKKAEPSGLQRGPQHGLRLFHAGLFRISYWRRKPIAPTGLRSQGATSMPPPSHPDRALRKPIVITNLLTARGHPGELRRSGEQRGHHCHAVAAQAVRHSATRKLR